MNAEQRDAICQLWMEIFGTQEGAGYNCPQGAYDFAEVVMSYEREACAKVCDVEVEYYKSDDLHFAVERAAAAIRARGGK